MSERQEKKRRYNQQLEYIVEDCGGAINGNRIDIYFESHADALQFGVQTVTVEILQEEE